ncbi:MAG: hypothetical protein ACRCZI_02785, partial [Cetobacterium sp.]
SVLLVFIYYLYMAMEKFFYFFGGCPLNGRHDLENFSMRILLGIAAGICSGILMGVLAGILYEGF